MARQSRLAVLALLAAVVALPAFADDATYAAQDQQPTASAPQDEPRTLDALIVTGATDNGDTRHYASDSKANVPEISDSDWVPQAN